MNPSGIVSEYFNKEYVKESHSTRLLTLLMNYWATEKDYEIKSQLLKKLIFKYAEAERKLAEANQMKNKLIGLVAHDLRSPLASIRGLSEILIDGGVGSFTGEQRDFLSTIYSASNTMLTLVNDILDVSTIESGKLELHIKKESLKRLIKERVNIIKVLSDQKGIAIRSRLADIPDVPFDRNRIAQVIDNLLGNAIKFSPHGKSVYIALSRNGSVATVKIRDEGVGISKEDMPRLFKEFQTLGVEPTGGEKCTGLGLAIAKKIIDEHRGAIEIKSSPGKGATFIVTLPLEDSHGV
jgi:signal transduction histidine kinase